MAKRAQTRGERAATGEPTVAEIAQMAREADEAGLAVLERSLSGDTRKGVKSALAAARRRLDAEAAERRRLDALFENERGIVASHGGVRAVGLDEVGRGPLAGPLAVGAVVLPDGARIEGLNDSKRVAPEARERIAQEIRDVAIAWSVVYVEPADIDAHGMSASLRSAFSAAIADIESQGAEFDVVLLDGNPLHCDPREVNVVKGDATCASIAAASIIAKVSRDELMERYDELYPEYGFASNKGYASEAHIDAIRRLGLSPVHRASFCTAFAQQTLF